MKPVKRRHELLMECPKEYMHTPCPSGYVEWHEWAEKKGETHRQIRCPGCRRYSIWVRVKP